MTSHEIRQQFIEFFREREHEIVPSSPVVPHDDPTLMFANAGMNQFKPYFLGTEIAKRPRATDTQKCIRAGGKHNDLDDVGRDTYHHTFFEMLGNWSFGDYFKKEAIAWAWELLTEKWAIDKERLHATYFEGDAAEGLEPDTEARDLWLAYLPADRVHTGNKKDNFWEMGDTGPCGPCSEIHVDLTPDKTGGPLVNGDDARVIELWNLVFIQFNRAADGKLSPLPSKHVDTGMGFERLCAILNDKKSNYDTDVFAPLFAAIQKRCGAPDYQGTLPGEHSRPSRDRKGADDHTSVVVAPRAYLITYHTYGTWLHGTERGSVDREHNQPATPFVETNDKRERNESSRLKHDPIILDKRRREIVDATIREVADHRGWTIHSLNVRTNHVHVVVSADVPPERVMNDFKSYATRRMVEQTVLPASTKAWTRHGSTRYLWTEDAVAGAREYVQESQGPDLPLGDIGKPLPYGRGSEKPSPNEQSRDRKGAVECQIMVDVAYRVIADHVRCLTFALTDGAIPSNEGRGYVLRRILRRAVRYGRQYLGMQEPFLCDIVPAVIEQMADAFPELTKRPDHVVELIREEEASFGKTLTRGIQLFNEAADRAVEQHDGLISGADAFKLHDTYGFPVDLTELMAEERGLKVDIGEYERLMEEARQKARTAGKLPLVTAIRIDAERLDKTNFVGYTNTEYDSVCERVFNEIDGELRATGGHLKAGERGALVVRDTPFYAEQGGQVGDKGHIADADGSWLFVVEDTQKQNDVFLHLGRCERGQVRARGRADASASESASIRQPRAQGNVKLAVNIETRRPTMSNHTSTHILNWALREVLGENVQQKGSLVDPEKTRFDFSHNKPVTADELRRIESLVNAQIAADYHVHTKEVEQGAARAINTLRAVFGEKYPDVVRVVSIGADIDEMLADPTNEKWMKYSVEFCGGTHLQKTSEAEDFVLIAEEAVAKGVRRLVGMSGAAAQDARQRGQALLVKARALPSRDRKGAEDEADANLAERLSALKTELETAVIPITTRLEIRELLSQVQKTIKAQSKQAATAAAGDVMTRAQTLLDGAQSVGDTKVIVGEVPQANTDALRGAVDWFRQKTESSAVLLACHDGEKVTLLAGMSKDVVAKGVKAGDLIREIAPIVGGKGGGRPDMAQGGGGKPEAIGEAIERAGAWLAERIAG